MTRAYLHAAMPEFDGETEIRVGTNALRLEVENGLLIVFTMDARLVWIPLGNVRLIQ